MMEVTIVNAYALLKLRNLTVKLDGDCVSLQGECRPEDGGLSYLGTLQFTRHEKPATFNGYAYTYSIHPFNGDADENPEAVTPVLRYYRHRGWDMEYKIKRDGVFGEGTEVTLKIAKGDRMLFLRFYRTGEGKIYHVEIEGEENADTLFNDLKE